MSRIFSTSLVTLTLACAGCSSDSMDLDGGGVTTADSGTADGAVADAGGDAGVIDAGEDAGASEPDAGSIDPSTEPFRTLRNNGTSDKKLDIVFVGDGYTLDELASTYADHVDKLAEGMFAARIQNAVNEPFRTYRDLFNVHRVHVASNESGIDEDGTMDTAFDGRTACGGFSTSCYVNAEKVHAAVDAALAGSGITADWIVVTLNTDTKIGGVVPHADGNIAVYGGGYGGNGRTSYLGREIGLRELARAFCNVGYEFFTPGTMYAGSEPAEVNLTTTATAPKWARWDGFDVSRDGLTPVGSYEGGGGYATGIYRPTEESKMGPQDGQGTLRFNAVTQEAIILAIYEHVPIVVSQDPTGNGPFVDPVVLYVEVGGSVEVEWAIDGVVVDGQTGPAFGITDHARLEGIGAGTYEVTAHVIDDTNLVRIEPRTGLEATVSWTVELTGN